MTPVNQSKLYSPDGIHNGNCFAACLASLLDLPLWMVPPFEDMFGRGDWAVRRDEWLYRMFKMRLARIEGFGWGQVMPAEYWIANGPSARGVHHSVIYSRETMQMVHDPHPAKSGVEKVDWIWYLEAA